MAQVRTIATALIRFRGDSSRFNAEARQAAKAAGVTRRELRRLEQRARRFNNTITRTVGRLSDIRTGLVAVGAVSAVGFGVRQAVDAAAAQDLLARNVGLTSEQYQGLSHAARQNGVAQQELDSAVRALSARLGQAAAGIGEAVRGFEEADIAIADSAGNLRPVAAILDDVADAVARTTDQGERTRILFAAFGEQGVRLGQAFSQGAAGLAAYRAELDQIGGLLSENLSARARILSDEFDRLGTTIRTSVSRAILENSDRLLEVVSVLRERVPQAIAVVANGLTLAARSADVLASTLAGLFTAALTRSVLGLASGIGALVQAFRLGATGAIIFRTAINPLAGLIGVLGGIAAHLAIIRPAFSGTSEDVRRLNRAVEALAASTGDLTMQYERQASAIRNASQGLVLLRTSYEAILQAASREQAIDLGLVANDAEVRRLAEQVRNLERVAARGGRGAAVAAREAERFYVRFLQAAGSAWTRVGQQIDAQGEALRNLSETTRATTAAITDQAETAEEAAARIRRAFIQTLTNIRSSRREFAGLLGETTGAVVGAVDAAGVGANRLVVAGRQVEASLVEPLLDANRATRDLADNTRGLQAGLANVTQAASSTFSEIVRGAESADAALRRLLGTIVDTLLQLSLNTGLAALFPNLAGVIPTFARGGVAGSGLAVVGEEGPELISLAGSTRIISQREILRAVGDDGGGTTVNIRVEGVNDPEAVAREIRALIPTVEVAVARGIERPGRLRNAVQRASR